ncbi:MAG: hypothetical protein EKK64_00340 [Neisseriaceae bacterium]|nr:MAG: hypothetical protein EKK64_00340 [Neisseriaceae bacterium]
MPASAKMKSRIEDFHLEEDEEIDFSDQDLNENGVAEFSKDFQENAKNIAIKYIKHFFEDKEYFLGGTIPQEELFSSTNVSAVLNYNIEDAVDIAYVALKPLLLDEQKKIGRLEVSCDIRIVVGVLKMLSISCIPRQFAGGLMLLYLKYVEGIKVAL